MQPSCTQVDHKLVGNLLLLKYRQMYIVHFYLGPDNHLTPGSGLAPSGERPDVGQPSKEREEQKRVFFPFSPSGRQSAVMDGSQRASYTISIPKSKRGNIYVESESLNPINMFVPSYFLVSLIVECKANKFE